MDCVVHGVAESWTWLNDFQKIKYLIWFLFFLLLVWCITLIEWILSQHCICEINNTWSWFHNTFLCKVEFSVNIFSRIFNLCILCIFCIYVYGLSFFVKSISGLGIRVIFTSQNEFDSVTFSSYLWNSLKRIGISFLYVLGRILLWRLFIHFCLLSGFFFFFFTITTNLVSILVI